MAKWTKKKVTPEEINNGNEYNVNDNLSVESINAIINNSFKAQEDSEEALKKANSAYEANGTVVKINGEPQGTWDATYAQKITEEGANLLDVKTSSLTKNGITVSYNETTNVWTYSGTTTSTSFYIALPVNINLDATKTYTLFRDRTLNNNISTQITKTNVSNNGTIEADKTSVKLTNLSVGIPDSIMVYVKSIGVGTTINGEFKLSLIEGENFSGLFNSYNSASHITNPQADLLKSEWEKSANKANVTSYNTGSLSAYAWVVKGSLKLKANVTYTVSFFTTASLGSSQLYLNEKYFNGDTLLEGGYITGNFGLNSYVEKIITPTQDIVINNDTLVKTSYAREYSISKFMINEGSTRLEYQDWNGEIITQKSLRTNNAFEGNVSIYDASITNDQVGSVLPLRYNLSDFGAIYIQFYCTGGKIHGKYVPIHILKTKHASQWNALIVGELKDEYITIYYSSDTSLTVGARSTTLNSMRIFAI